MSVRSSIQSDLQMPRGKPFAFLPPTPTSREKRIEPKGEPVSYFPSSRWSKSQEPECAKAIVLRDDIETAFSRSLSCASTYLPDSPRPSCAAARNSVNVMASLAAFAKLCEGPSASLDGPALTSQGVALELGSGDAINFSHAVELSDGTDHKNIMLANARRLSDQRRRQAVLEGARRVDFEEVASLDILGSLHGPPEYKPPVSAKARLVRFRDMIRNRQRQSSLRTYIGECLCVGQDNRVSIYLNIGPSTETRHRMSEKIRRASSSGRMQYNEERFAVDAAGVAYFEEDSNCA